MNLCLHKKVSACLFTKTTKLIKSIKNCQRVKTLVDRSESFGCLARLVDLQACL